MTQYFDVISIKSAILLASFIICAAAERVLSFKQVSSVWTEQFVKQLVLTEICSFMNIGKSDEI